MNYLHHNFKIGPEDVVKVSLDKQANVRLLDDSNYAKYRAGQKHRYFGGAAAKSPVHLTPPHEGNWHLVIDLGGYPGAVRASVEVLKKH